MANSLLYGDHEIRLSDAQDTTKLANEITLALTSEGRTPWVSVIDDNGVEQSFFVTAGIPIRFFEPGEQKGVTAHFI